MVGYLSKFYLIPEEEYFSETAYGCSAIYFVKIIIMMFSICFKTPPLKN